MGKALMVWGLAATLASGRGLVLAGGSQSSTNETLTSLEATEAATFSGLSYRIISGGGGTNNLAFWKNVAAGNQIATVAGPGLAVDATNTDVLAAGDLFTGAATDNGTDPADIPFAICNVAFSSGHGNFHACSNALAVNHDVASGTRYIPFAGEMIQDGGTTVANQQFKNRAYTTCEAVQVRVSLNSRTTDSTLSLNVNGSNVGSAITIGAGLTGLFTVEAMGQSLATGDLVCAALTTGTGTEDMNLTAVCGTFKSTTDKSEALAHNETGLARTASATANYIPPGGNLSFSLAASEANSRVKIGFAATLSNLRSFLIANTCTGSQTVKIFVNGSAVLTLTISASATGWQENTTDTISIDADDEVSLEFDEGSSGSATFSSVGFTLAPSSGALSAQAAITEAGDTVASTGVLAIAAAAAITEAGDTVASAATLPIVASSSVTEVDALASTASVLIASAASILEGDDVVASASVSPIAAVASITEAGDTCSSAGTLAIVGSVAVTEADDTVSATGVLPLVAGAAITEEGDAVSAVIGSLSLSADSELLEEDDSVSSSSAVLISAVADITEGADSVSSESAVLISTVADLLEGDDSVSSAGAVLISAAASITDAGDSLSSEAGVVGAGFRAGLWFLGIAGEVEEGALTAFITEDNDTLASTASSQIVASLAVTEGGDGLVSTISFQPELSFAVTEDNDTLVSTAVSQISASAAITEAGDTLGSTIVVAAAGSILAAASITEAGDTLSSVATLGFFQPATIGKRKLPKRRRATILRHMETLKRVPRADLYKEMELARLNLQKLEAIDQLLNAQDRLLLDRYRDIYLEYVLKQDDETIILLAG